MLAEGGRDAEAFANWLAGFIDGEGCFTIREQKGHNKNSLSCEFHVTLRIDDVAILFEIVSRTGLGGIGYTKGDGGHGRNGNPQARWTIRKRGEALGLIWLLDNHPLRAKKLRDYKIWRQAVLVWSDVQPGGYGKAENAPVWAQMRRLRTQLMTGRAFEPPIEAEWFPTQLNLNEQLR